MSCASQFLHLFSFGADSAEASNLLISAALLAALVHSAFVGTGLVRSDLERGTLALMMSQPVGLPHYLGGRFFGLFASSLFVSALTLAGVAAVLLLAGAHGAMSLSCLLSLGRVALGTLVLSAAALAASAALGRVFAPVLLLGLFLAGDVVAATPLGRVLPNFGAFALDATRTASWPWLTLYAALYSVVFLAAAYLRLTLRPASRTET